MQITGHYALEHIHIVKRMWLFGRSHGCAALNQLSMWRQLQLHTEMSGMHQAAQTTVLCQPCQALPQNLFQYVPSVGSAGL